MSVWPLVNRNKVEDSAIDAAVREALEYESADEEIKRIGNDVRSISLVAPPVSLLTHRSH